MEKGQESLRVWGRRHGPASGATVWEERGSPAPGFPILKGDMLLHQGPCVLAVLGALESVAPPLLRSEASCPKTEGPSAGPAGPPANISLSLLPWQDCENYITLLERKGEGLLICGTNARRPSCWSLVRRPLPVHLVSSPSSGWASAPTTLGRSWGGGTLRLASLCIKSPGGWGSWLGSWRPQEAVAMASCAV